MVSTNRLKDTESMTKMAYLLLYVLVWARGGNVQPFVIDDKQSVRAVLTPDREEKRQNGRRMKEDGEPMFTLTAQDRHGVAVTENDIVTYNVQQTVKVRKQEVNVIELQVLLRGAKTKGLLTNKQIADALGVPITKVEHWFRVDDGFAIPTPEIWSKLKEVLKIETDEFDAPIMEFVEQDNNFDQANRVYGVEGIAPTVTRAKPDIPILIAEKNWGQTPINTNSDGTSRCICAGLYKQNWSHFDPTREKQTYTGVVVNETDTNKVCETEKG